MGEDQSQNHSDLVPSVSRALTTRSAALVRRGLDDLLVQQPQVIEEEYGHETLDDKKAEPVQASLFGDIAAPAIEGQYSNETLDDIRAEMGDCQRCKLWKTRTQLVFGEGNAKAELMFVGEAPGADEEMTGRPFVGRCGQLLNKMIEAIGMKREDVYLATVIKSRPHGNRNPEKDEIAACIPFLLRQIAAIRPRLIVTLGNSATQALLETQALITEIRGEFQDYPSIAGIKVLPMFHPADLLYTPDKKREVWEDLKKIRAFLRGEILGERVELSRQQVTDKSLIAQATWAQVALASWKAEHYGGEFGCEYDLDTLTMLYLRQILKPDSQKK